MAEAVVQVQLRGDLRGCEQIVVSKSHEFRVEGVCVRAPARGSSSAPITPVDLRLELDVVEGRGGEEQARVDDRVQEKIGEIADSSGAEFEGGPETLDLADAFVYREVDVGDRH